MDETELVKIMTQKFDEFTKNHSLTFSLDEFDKEFGLKKIIFQRQYIDDIESTLGESITNTYISWHNYLHGLLIPNSRNLSNVEESNLFSEEEKQNIMELVTKSLEFSSENALLSLQNEEEKLVDFYNRAYTFYVQKYKPKLVDIITKIHIHWKEKKRDISKNDSYDGLV